MDGRTDVYSLGCVLYEMLTGSVAYPKDNDMAKLWAHVRTRRPRRSLKRPELVEAFDDVVARATAKDPDDRYARASDLADAVDRAVAEQNASARPGCRSTRPARPARSLVPTSMTCSSRAPAPEPRPPEAPATRPPPGERRRRRSPAPAAPEPARRASVGACCSRLAGVVRRAGRAAAAVLLAGGGGGDDEEAPQPAAAGAGRRPSSRRTSTWRPIASPPFRRQYAAATTVDGKVW